MNIKDKTKYHHNQGNYRVLEETCLTNGTESYRIIRRTSSVFVLDELVSIYD